jgi:hypothetical protein
MERQRLRSRHKHAVAEVGSGWQRTGVPSESDAKPRASTDATGLEAGWDRLV